MFTPTRSWLLSALVVGLTTGCFGGGDEPGGDDGTEPLGGALTVSGDVVDFSSGAGVQVSKAVVSGITPAPAVATEGSTFTIEQVPENSVFQILASAESYRPTYSPAIQVLAADVTGLRAPIVSGAYVEQLAVAFGVTASTARGIVMVKLVDSNGAPRAGVPAAQLAMGTDARGPFFLDAEGNAAIDATETSASGYAIWFEVAPGSAQVVAAANATIGVDMAVAPVTEGAVTLANARVSEGGGGGGGGGGTTPTPTNVSFSRDIFPIFSVRGCEACHSGNGPGRDLGGLTLDGSANLAYRELTQERANRVSLASPETSLLLLKPLKEEPPNHQTATFQNNQDPDYLKILAWIREGAKDN